LPAVLALVLLSAAAFQLSLPASETAGQNGAPVRPVRWALPEIGEPSAPAPSLVPWLFTPGRIGQPQGVAKADGEAEGDTPAPPPKHRFGPLAGAWVVGSIRVAAARSVVIRPAHGSSIRLPIGGAWRGWQLSAIQDDAALFRRGGKTRRIKFGTAPAGGSDDSGSENTSE
jgi:hypothetical protein